MKTQTRTILAACLAIAICKNLAISVKVSSKIELDSDENEEALNDMSSEAVANLNKSASPSELIVRAPKQPTFNRRRGSEFSREYSRESRKRRICTSHGDSSDQIKPNQSNQPNVINNIRIVVNGNDSMANASSCERGVCNVSISSKPDGRGNIVTEVYLSIVANAATDRRIDEVPVIDGLRGIDDERDERPIFHHSIKTLNPLHLYVHRDNFPQIQPNYQGYGESWYQRPRTFQRPRTYWDYRHFGDRSDVGPRGRKTWSRDRPIVDDKIEPPLSDTKSGNET